MATTLFERVNQKAERSWVGRYFQLKERNTRLTTELRAGTVTFLTMAYILAVNGSIVADTGGPCSAADCEFNTGVAGCQFGLNGQADPGFANCRERVRRSLTTATAVSTMISCFLMGLVGNLPFAVAPGMGINAFFTYTVVGFNGFNGMVSYQQALAAAFVEGWIIYLIAVSGARHAFVKAMPNCVLLATSGGIGMFLAFIGFQTSNGIGLISFDSATLVTLGGCPVEDRAHMYTIANTSAVCEVDPDTGMLITGPNLGAPSGNYACLRNRMRSPSLWLGIMGGVLMVLLMARGFRAAIILAILFTTFISWIPGHGASYLGIESQIPFGAERKSYFKKVVTVPDTQPTDLELDFTAFGKAQFWAALASFLYLDFLDTTGTFYSMATYMNKKLPGFIDPVKKEFPGITAAYCVDATAIWIGALLGLPPLTTYIESATGIREGGRTGLTAITVSFYFMLAMFFTPIMASIPPYATGPALVLVGALMIENLLDINWKDPQQAIPAFLTISVIPLTYSVAYGVLAGITSYMLLWFLLALFDLITAPLYGRSCAAVLAASCPTFLNFSSLKRNSTGSKGAGGGPTSGSGSGSQEGSGHNKDITNDKELKASKDGEMSSQPALSASSLQQQQQQQHSSIYAAPQQLHLNPQQGPNGGARDSSPNMGGVARGPSGHVASPVSRRSVGSYSRASHRSNPST